ncbi:MAG: hypothetical protein ACLFUB_06680 [Cyclobacteriaceae bacterium]
MRTFSVFFVATLFSANFAMAQDEVTNEQLYKFAIIEETKTIFASELSAQITEFVEKQDTEIKNRYNALAGGEEPANDAEAKFIQMVNEMKTERTAEYSDAYKSLVKRLMGASDYKTVKTAIASDARVRAKFTDMVEDIRTAAKGGDASASTGE